MCSSFTPPRRVKIGDVASFVGTTPRAVRHYHQIGLLPEPERGSDDRRRYGYAEMVRLLWIRRMADAGIALDDIRDAFADTALPGARGEPGARADTDHDVAGVLERLEQTLAAREAALQRQRAAVRRLRTRGSRAGLLSDVVSERLARLPEGFLRQDDLDTLLVTERIFGPLGAAVQATRLIALAAHPGLRAEGDGVDAAEEALDDTVAVDDPRVARVAARRHAFERALDAVIEESGLAQDDEALFDSWEETHPAGTEGGTGDDAGGESRAPGGGHGSMSAVEAVGKVPYDFSPARLRCIELAGELGAQEAPAPPTPPTA